MDRKTKNKTRKILIRISYDGTAYSGFQFQENAVTIQEKLEKAIHKIYKEEIRVAGAGRTDSGVHALGQAVTFSAPPVVPVESIPLALNSKLPRDIVVWDACQVPDDFHARLHASGKKYCYTIDIAPYTQVLRRHYAWHCREALDIELMQEACRHFIGTHDFLAFRSTGSKIENTVRTIFSAQLIHEKENNLLVFRVFGNGFLYKMVRKMVGALVHTGRGRFTPSEIKEALANPEDNLFPAMQAKGLCLEEVTYPDNLKKTFVYY